MIIIPQLFSERLSLNAYSYQDNEFNILVSFLVLNAFEYEARRLDNDKSDRKGICFTINKLTQILRFQNILGVVFSGFDSATTARFGPVEGGTPYRCIRLKGQPWEDGCVDISASNATAAFIKCSLVANHRNWFGAESEEGSCQGNW